jgi:hypothetical protein
MDSKLKNRKYKSIYTCQLDGCNNPILKKTKKKRNKYCCDEHAKLAQKQYRKIWVKENKDKIRLINKRYFKKNKPIKTCKLRKPRLKTSKDYLKKYLDSKRSI